ncbi:PLP-dependent cysteine synthase family protein [candidate division KSB1 bacterium]
MSNDICNSVLEIIGSTPLVVLNSLPDKDGPEILAKIEYVNPGGSIKDRIARAMIEDAENRGLLKPGGTVIESTSGNTGIGIALTAAVKGYKCIIVMTDKQGPEKVALLKAYGAEVVIVPASAKPDSPEYNINTARRIQQETPDSYMTDQDYNQVNPETHYKFTGPELWEQCKGRIDVLVSGIGTGGTISGIAKFLKEKNPRIRSVGVEPAGSVFRSFMETGSVQLAGEHHMTGIGDDKIPGTVWFDYIDEIVEVSDDDSFSTARRLTREEAILAGPSAGCAVFAALNTAQSLSSDKRIVTIIPDTGHRYLNSLYSDDWMTSRGLL